jgi:capsule polysaccharide export protein KpsE/RkpR
MEGDLNLLNLIRWLWRKKYPILIVEVIAITASIIFTSPRFVRPEFRSYATFFPVNMGPYPLEVYMEELIQNLKSVDLKNEVIRDFNLIKHYKIDTTKKFWYSNLLKLYDSKVDVDVTNYNAVLLQVYDVNPDTACMIAKDIIRQVNNNILADQREKASEYAGTYKKELDIKKRDIDSLSSLAKVLSIQYGLIDYNGQTRELERAYYQMLSNSKGGKPLDETSAQIKNLEEKGEQFREVNQHLSSALTAYDDLLFKYQNAMSDANKKQTFLSVISKPYPDDAKARPKRLVTILLLAVSVLLISAVILRFLERIKQ